MTYTPVTFFQRVIADLTGVRQIVDYAIQQRLHTPITQGRSNKDWDKTTHQDGTMNSRL